MFKSFFLDKKWFHWSILGSIIILGVTWYKVQVDVQINEWYGGFYNMIQEALSNPGKIKIDDFFDQCLTFLEIVSVYIVVVVLLEFYVKHYVFRWRTAMNDYYMSNWPIIRHIEGASQRVQEDTMRFAKIMEHLGVTFIRAVMTLIAFLPILWELSKHVKEVPVFGEVSHSLVYVALISAIFGTVILALVGIKLPGLEFNNQKVEAAYRKELVLGEDHADRADPPSVKELFGDVRSNYFRLYLHYLYFDVAKWSYLQASVLLPLIVLAPTIIAGGITLGIFHRILQAFNKVEESFQFLVNSWSTIVELMSIHKRLKAFEKQLDEAKLADQPA